MNKTMQKIEHAVRNKKSMTNGNYAVFRNDDTDYTAVQYHSTIVVAIFHREGKAYLGNGGWFTPTTKNVINAALFGAGAKASVFQKNYEWFVGDQPYYDGIEVPLAA